MDLCALILAHEKFELLGRLTSRLSDAGVESFVHVDRNSSLEPFLQACHGHRARFLENRIAVFWGGMSVVSATLRLAVRALEDTDCSHFALVSGDSYLLRGRSSIDAWLRSNVDYIDVNEILSHETLYARIAQTYFPDHPVTAFRDTVDFQRRALDDTFFQDVEALRRIYAMKSQTSFPWRYAKGSNWWLLRRTTLERCLRLAKDPDYQDWFRYSAVPDESFFNTLVLNFFDLAQTRPSPMFDIWDRPPPRPYRFATVSDLATLGATDSLFARKFESNCDDLLDAIDEWT